MNLWERIGASRLVWALSLARMGDAIGNSILFVVIPLYVSALPHPLLSLREPLLVAVLISVYGFLTTILQPLVGAVSDWTRRPKLLIQIGLLVIVSATVACVWANHYLDLLWIRMGQGLGFALTVPTSMALMAIGTLRRTRGGSMGIYTTLRMAGLSIGPALGGFLVDRLGFNAAFYTGAGFVALGFVAVTWWVREQPPSPEPRRLRIFDPALLKPGLLAVASSTLVMAAAFSELVPLEKQVNHRTHETAVGFGLSFTALMLSRLVLQIPLGHLSDRLGRKPIIIIGLIVMAPATVLLATSGSAFALAGWRVMQGAAAAAIAAPAFAVAADLSRGGGEGRQMSIATMGFTMGIAVGPLLAGWLVVYSFELPFIVTAVFCLISAASIYIFVPETVRHKQET